MRERLYFYVYIKVYDNPKLIIINFYFNQIYVFIDSYKKKFTNDIHSLIS